MLGIFLIGIWGLDPFRVDDKGERPLKNRYTECRMGHYSAPFGSLGLLQVCLRQISSAQPQPDFAANLWSQFFVAGADGETGLMPTNPSRFCRRATSADY